MIIIYLKTETIFEEKDMMRWAWLIFKAGQYIGDDDTINNVEFDFFGEKIMITGNDIKSEHESRMRYNSVRMRYHKNDDTLKIIFEDWFYESRLDFENAIKRKDMHNNLRIED
ncbi:MAG: hypothetical protein FWC41_00545 [Firmicutes bacterium]|nr:hypothetical protein [Bacillota bacterium]